MGAFFTEGRGRGIVRGHIVREKRRGGNDLAEPPEDAECLNGTLHAEIHEALNDDAEDEGARCIVLRGEGRGFSAGADLADITGRGGVLREARARLHRKLKGAPKERVVGRERTRYDSLDSGQETFQGGRGRHQLTLAEATRRYGHGD
ncbi:MAG: enoyl-CoA hydratase-related protein [Actinomycetota bacterium]|nr:enoyl-CoA hydratase-related protein [Actinomycetota bacterium]